MNLRLAPSMIALSVLTLSLLALIVGVYNAVISPRHTMTLRSEKAESGLAAFLTKSTSLHARRLVSVNLSGPITMEADQKSGFLGGESNAVSVRKALDEAAKDDQVKGVLLKIDSPGGTVAMSQELNAAVKRVREKKPIVAYFGDLAASGGYYTACAADKIVSNPGTLTASIGVIISTLNFHDLMYNKLGMKAYTIKSGKFKDILSPYREMTPEDQALIQNMINTSYHQFLNAVIDGRTRQFGKNETQQKLALAKTITSIADGRIIVGEDALKLGLVDKLGDIDVAAKLLDKMAKERFHIRGKAPLPMEESQEGRNLLDLLGIDVRSFGSGMSAMTQADPAALLSRYALPLSARYPNQPLWIME